MVSDTNIQLKDEEKNIKPTVANWLRSYNQFFSSNQRRSHIEEGEYLLKDVNAAKLNKKDKELLTKLIQLYDFLRFPDQVSQGPVVSKRKRFGKLAPPVEKEKPQPVILEQESVVTPSDAEQEILTAYQGNEKQQKAILKQESKLNKKFKDDVTKLRPEFFKTVQKKDVDRTIAILRVLAQKDDLANFLKDDAKLNKFLAAIWEKQYGKDVAEQFSQNPTDIRFVRLFLRYVLEQRLEFNSNDAARIGLQIANIFVSFGKKEYNKMAYFDVKTKTFAWFE